MSGDALLTTFPNSEEFQKALIALDHLNREHGIVIPGPGFSLVAVPALVMSRESRNILETASPTIVFSGWVDYRKTRLNISNGAAPEDAQPDDCFRRASVMFLGPCVADETKIRLIAHIDGDLGPVLPYLNAVIPQASYTPAAETLTYMDEYRMIALYRQRITIAKADEIVDAWRVLEEIRRSAVQTWKKRDRIEPSFEIRRKPPAIEIFKRLPRTNCGLCGEPSCLAFAMRVWTGELSARFCLPAFEEGGQFAYLQGPLLDICAGMGIKADRQV